MPTTIIPQPTAPDPNDIPTLLPDLDVPIPQTGSVYPDFESLRYAVNAWALREKFLSRIHKKDSTRAIYICRRHESGCEWRIRANVSRETGKEVVVSVVQPLHTCVRADGVNDHGGAGDVSNAAAGEGSSGGNGVGVGKPKYLKRGVQFTQRWVRDSLARIGFHVHVDTDPKEIVRALERRFGETISEQLALKSKTSLLVSRGEIPARKPGRPGRPSLASLEQRERDVEAGMRMRGAQDQDQDQEDIDDEDTAFGGPEGDEVDADAEERPFVFQSGARVIGPLSQNRRPTLTPRHSSQSHPHLDPRLAGIGVAPPDDQTYVTLSPTPVNSRLPASSYDNARLCQTCGGTGIARTAPTANESELTLVIGDNGKDELEILRRQVGLLSQQIELMQRRRRDAAG